MFRKRLEEQPEWSSRHEAIALPQQLRVCPKDRSPVQKRSLFDVFKLKTILGRVGHRWLSESVRWFPGKSMVSSQMVLESEIDAVAPPPPLRANFGPSVSKGPFGGCFRQETSSKTLIVGRFSELLCAL